MFVQFKLTFPFFKLVFHAVVTAVYCCIPIFRDYSEGSSLSSAVIRVLFLLRGEFCVRIPCTLIYEGI